MRYLDVTIFTLSIFVAVFFAWWAYRKRSLTSWLFFGLWTITVAVGIFMVPRLREMNRTVGNAVEFVGGVVWLVIIYKMDSVYDFLYDRFKWH